MNRLLIFSLLLLLPVFLTSQVIIDESSASLKSDTEVIFYVNINVYLEGPFFDGQMLSDLNKSKLLPLSQPFNVPPWNYNGTESVSSIPSGNVVDWVFVELRNGLSPDSATSASAFGKQAAFLLNSGKVVGTDGISHLVFDTTYT